MSGTSYTYPIIEAKIHTLPEFATLCMRAFGACMHLRETSLATEYIPSIPSDYYIKQQMVAQLDIDQLSNTTPEQYFNILILRYEQEIKRLTISIEENKQIRHRLNTMLEKVKQWEMPSDEYHEFKRFMINQLEQTLDGNSDKYILQKLDTNHHQLQILTIEVAANELSRSINCAKQNLANYKEEYIKEVEGCNNANKWVETLLKSLGE